LYFLKTKVIIILFISIPETNSGRWFTMDAGNIDGDGKLDYSAGNCSFGPTLEQSTFNWKKGPPFMVYNHYCPIKKVRVREFSHTGASSLLS